MGRGDKFTGRICIESDGETIPYLSIDEDGVVTWLVSDERQKEIEQKMLRNIGESMSLYYAAHPEYLKGESL